MKYKMFLIAVAISLTASAQTPVKKRSLVPADVYRLATVSDPQISSDGNWVAYVLTTVDTAKDKHNSDVWMVSWDGQQTVQLTHASEGESSPRWSPDGKFISFLSSRYGAKGSQVWLMDRRGGEAKKLTDIKGELSDYVWSPDSKKIMMVIQDPPDTSKTKTAKPVVIDRYHFKQDIEGYRMRRYEHLYLFDIATKNLDTLTKGKHNETSPQWSPDGTRIAFVSNHTADPDKNSNSDIWIIDAKKGSTAKQFTTWTGSDTDPQWSPDGKQVAWLQSSAATNFIMYDQPVLAVAPAVGGEPKLLTASIDRPVGDIVWKKSGDGIYVTVTDDREHTIKTIGLKDEPPVLIAGGVRSFYGLEANDEGKLVSLMSEPQQPEEVYAIENGSYRRLTNHHAEFLAPLTLATVRGFTSKSKDGTTVSNILYLPAGASDRPKLPTIFYIHGGPVSQDDYEFDLSRQQLAAAGYAVVAINYRGSDGRGVDYSKAIYADWGNKEVTDILGAVDEVVKMGIADPDRLGIGGWSYGGILTDYTIATDTRFKAAVSGAGSALQLSIYGTDQYVLQYEEELGVPWKNTEKYMKLSYPFLHADRIKTPTLFMVGEKDFNVPAVGSEQMYQALRSQDIPTELVIYPGQFHGITTPSYQKDRYTRYIQWFDKYLKGINKPKLSKEK